MSQSKQRFLTGSRPSGSPHLGNYFGAYKPAIDQQDRYELFFFLADFHALNENFTAAQMQTYSIDLVASMVAAGLDPQRSCFYAQSTVPEVNELAWILACQIPYGMLLRAHSFKDAQAKGLDINMGLFNYPILMAADILLYDATIVPVGQDQKQHLEMARDFAQRFNNRYGELFILPEPLISENVAIVPGTDGQKMSKSKGNVVPIFGSDKVWKQQIMSIVTDTKSLEDAKDPDTCNIFALYKLLATASEAEDMAGKYRAGGFGYGHAKLALLEKMQATFGPMRARYEELLKRPDDLRDMIATGSRRAKAIAKTKLIKVHEVLGLLGQHRL